MTKFREVIVNVILWMNVIAGENGGKLLNESPLVQEFSFKALQCNDVRTTATYSGRKFCDEEKMKKEYIFNMSLIEILKEKIINKIIVLKTDDGIEYKGMAVDVKVEKIVITSACPEGIPAHLIESSSKYFLHLVNGRFTILL
jgi:hypothetical protein